MRLARLPAHERSFEFLASGTEDRSPSCTLIRMYTPVGSMLFSGGPQALWGAPSHPPLVHTHLLLHLLIFNVAVASTAPRWLCPGRFIFPRACWLTNGAQCILRWRGMSCADDIREWASLPGRLSSLWKVDGITFAPVSPPCLPLPGPHWALQTPPHTSQIWANLLSGLEESGFWAGIRAPRDVDLCGGQWLVPDPCPSMMGHRTLAIAAMVVWVMDEPGFQASSKVCSLSHGCHPKPP